VKPGGLWMAAGLYVVMIGIMAVWLQASNNPPKTTTVATQPGKSSAWVMAQKFVKQQLKSPGSASFGSLFRDYQNYEDVVADLGGGKFRVRAWVDSDNVFGATLRNHFVCELQYTGNDRWQLLDLTFREQ